MCQRLLQRVRETKGKAKGQPKAKQEAWHTALDRIIDDQQSEMHRDALIKEKRAREEAERKTKAVDAQVRVKDQQVLIAEQQLKLTRDVAARGTCSSHCTPLGVAPFKLPPN